MAAVLIRLALQPFLNDKLPYFTVYAAVMISARYWGLGPGLLATAIGGAGGWLLFAGGDPLRLLLYLAVALLALWIITVLRRALVQEAESARLAAERLEQLKAQTSQREKEEERFAQLRAIVESSEDAIISKDLQGVITSWNHAAEQIFGYTAAEMIGKPMAILVPPGRTHEESDILERMRRGGRVSHFETIRARKDGELRHVALTLSPIRDSAGQIVGISHIARDVTERKQFEEQVRQTQRLESLGVLAGGLAHDFNNLLTGIMGNASLAQDELDERSPLRERIDEIVQAADRAATLVRQMLAYAGKGRFVMERMDLSQQVTQILDLIRTSIPRSVDLDLKLANDLPLVEADRSQIQQLIMNLIINAGEAIGDAPGIVTITTSWQRAGSELQAVLEVRDTGCGMDEATKARIFDPFFTTKFTGRGLGLAAVIGIIRSQKGSISVDSAPGKGSRFTVVLPARPRSESTPAEPGAEFRGQGHVLVVDDEELIRKMARFTLERCGYSVEVAGDGRAAVDAFATRPGEFSVVLLDLTMPVMGGEEALRRIQEVRPDVPVVLSSGYAESEAVERFRDRHLAGFLQKPYTAVSLASKIKQAVKK